METTDNVHLEVPGPAPKSSKSSKSAQNDEAVSKPLAKDPVLGKLMKSLFGKPYTANNRQDDGQDPGVQRRDLDLCQDQVNELQEVEDKVVEEDKATFLETVPLVQAEIPTPIIQLKSSDGEIFSVELKVAELSLHIKEMMDELGVEENDIIPIPPNAPKISGTVLGKIIEWANHHKNDPVTTEHHDKVKPTHGMGSWDAKFLQVDETTLFQMIRAADFLNIKGLLDVTCKKVATMIKGKLTTEVRRRFNIQNDFSPEEESQVYKELELKWWDVSTFEETSAARIQIPKNSVKPMKIADHEDDQVVKDCFQNPIILRKVLEHLSNHQLFYELQFVNKLWKSEARSVLKKRGSLAANLSCDRSTGCQEELEAFIVHLREMNTVPYSAVSIDFHIDHLCPSVAMDSTYEAILDQLSLKHLSVSLSFGWSNLKDCPMLLLLKKLLQQFCLVIEELEVSISDEREEFIRHFIKDCSFPNLKVLKLEDSYGITSEAYTSYMQALVSRAENLQELHFDGDLNSLKNVLEGRNIVLQTTGEFRAPFESVPQSIAGALRLTNVEMKYPGPEFDFERFSRIAPVLLQASCTTLSSITFDAFLAVPLMCYEISFENVTSPRFFINYNAMERRWPQILRIAKNFDFNRIFPSTKSVEINLDNNCSGPYSHHMNLIILQADAAVRDPLPDRAANVKTLIIYRGKGNTDDLAASFFAESFPCIKNLKVPECSEIEFRSVWRRWVDEVVFEVRKVILPSTGNLDSVFCGIIPEEVAELRRKDDEFLKSVNIVPVMPAITSLNNIRNLNLKYTGISLDEQLSFDGTFMFSKVTALVAFARCPSLTVKIKVWTRKACTAMNHLQPYVIIDDGRGRPLT